MRNLIFAICGVIALNAQAGYYDTRTQVTEPDYGDMRTRSGSIYGREFNSRVDVYEDGVEIENGQIDGHSFSCRTTRYEDGYAATTCD
mgnify:FL=1